MNKVVIINTQYTYFFPSSIIWTNIFPVIACDGFQNVVMPARRSRACGKIHSARLIPNISRSWGWMDDRDMLIS